MESLERAITDALRAYSIDGSLVRAVRRIMRIVSGAMGGAMARRRWAGVGAKARGEEMSARARGRWATLSPAERSAEMKRRATVRAKNREAAK